MLNSRKMNGNLSIIRKRNKKNGLMVYLTFRIEIGNVTHPNYPKRISVKTASRFHEITNSHCQSKNRFKGQSIQVNCSR